MTCRSCKHSRAQLSIEDNRIDLYCAKSGELALKVCERFVYEPGTDEDEEAEEGLV